MCIYVPHPYTTSWPPSKWLCSEFHTTSCWNRALEMLVHVSVCSNLWISTNSIVMWVHKQTHTHTHILWMYTPMCAHTRTMMFIPPLGPCMYSTYVHMYVCRMDAKILCISLSSSIILCCGLAQPNHGYGIWPSDHVHSSGSVGCFSTPFLTKELVSCVGVLIRSHIRILLMYCLW